LIHRINYETRWLSRRDLVHVGYRAVRRLVELKGETKLLPRAFAEPMIRKIDDALEFIDVVHGIDCIENERERARELAGVEGEIRRRNREAFFGGVSNQAFPMNRPIGGRWFDDTSWSSEVLAAAARDAGSPSEDGGAAVQEGEPGGT